MEKQNHYMSIKQAKLIVNAHKRNLLNSFCNNYGYDYVKHENNKTISQKLRETETERERERTRTRKLYFTRIVV